MNNSVNNSMKNVKENMKKLEKNINVMSNRRERKPFTSLSQFLFLKSNTGIEFSLFLIAMYEDYILGKKDINDDITSFSNETLSSNQMKNSLGVKGNMFPMTLFLFKNNIWVNLMKKMIENLPEDHELRQKMNRREQFSNYDIYCAILSTVGAKRLVHVIRQIARKYIMTTFEPSENHPELTEDELNNRLERLVKSKLNVKVLDMSQYDVKNENKNSAERNSFLLEKTKKPTLEERIEIVKKLLRRFMVSGMNLYSDADFTSNSTIVLDSLEEDTHLTLMKDENGQVLLESSSWNNMNASPVKYQIWKNSKNTDELYSLLIPDMYVVYVLDKVWEKRNNNKKKNEMNETNKKKNNKMNENKMNVSENEQMGGKKSKKSEKSKKRDTSKKSKPKSHKKTKITHKKK